VENFDTCAIRNIIQDFSMYEKEIPCIPKLVLISNQKICFPWGRRSLDSLIKSLQFKWRKCHKNRKILAKRTNTVTDTVTWRLRYLEQIKSSGTVEVKYFSH